MFQILEAYGIPPDVVAAIRVMYENTSAVVITPEGEKEQFPMIQVCCKETPLLHSYSLSVSTMPFVLLSLTKMASP